MGLFGTKEKNEKNYDTEIALLNEGQKELAKISNKNKSDIVAFGIDFGDFKASVNSNVNEIWDYLRNLDSKLSDFNKWKEERNQEIKSIEKAKIELPNTLTYKEICKSLKGFSYLNPTSFKYYLYECGLLDLKINPINNTYRLSENYNKSEAEIKKYIHVTDGVLTFDRSILDYLVNNPNDLRNSIGKYVRKQNQYKKSKQHLSEIQVTNYQKEINKICGIVDNYDKDKWAKIYNIYKKEHPNFWNEHKKYVDTYMKEHPNAEKKPTMITYLVQEVGDGDVLLKIACELFVA